MIWFRKKDAAGLDAPRTAGGRVARDRDVSNNEVFGRWTEGIARGMGTPWFLLLLSVFCLAWLIWNTVAPDGWRFDSAALGFTALTLILSLQASYAAPMILLAQNRQDDRDRVQIEQDRQRAERNLADTEFLAREVVALRLAIKDLPDRDFVRAELRALLADLAAEDHADDRDARHRSDGGRWTGRRAMTAEHDRGQGPGARADASPAEAAVWAALDRVKDPEILRPVTDLGMVDSVRVSTGGAARVGIALTIAGCPAARRIESEVRDAAGTAAGIASADVSVRVMSPEERRAFTERVRGDRAKRPQQFGPDSLTRVIAVTSGKGGVGKSSLTAGLAVALAAQGLRVGLIDADVFGFSIPGILGLSRDGRVEGPTRVDDLILPPVAHGVKVISIGMFLGDQDPRSTAVSWRGPMLHRTMEQFLRDVWFGDLDVLLLDLPPGTGDIAISLGQLLPHAEVLVVTTPQEAAADVAVRSALVARQTGQRVIGVVENMAGLAQPDGSVLDLFGSGGGELVASRLSDDEHGTVPLLGSVPLSPEFRANGDAGSPAVISLPGDPAAREVLRIASVLSVRPQSLAGRSLGISPTG